MAEAFGRILLEASYSELAIAEEEDLEVDDDEKIDREWDMMSEVDELSFPLMPQDLSELFVAGTSTMMGSVF
ncbi:hypothetical protein Y032_0577g227 [Ancylostoma ceylanicum]|uniref:Uncharacterized protein n=1 Tax=Ancylostoma ceylanicum TaxID=53326 RepID=A0A016WPK5_9BILA|nr:hypothetical protein Y032_0577g227 [Ancylostoma ceylanicum]